MNGYITIWDVWLFVIGIFLLFLGVAGVANIYNQEVCEAKVYDMGGNYPRASGIFSEKCYAGYAGPNNETVRVK